MKQEGMEGTVRKLTILSYFANKKYNLSLIKPIHLSNLEPFSKQL